MVCVGQRYNSTPLHEVPQGKAVCCLLEIGYPNWYCGYCEFGRQHTLSVYPRLQYRDGYGFREVFAVGFVQRIGKLEGDRMCALFRFYFSFRLRFAVMFVGRIERNGGTLCDKAVGIINDDVMMTGAGKESVFRGRELEAGHRELVGKGVGHGVPVFYVGKIHTPAFRGTPGVRVRRGQHGRGDDGHRGSSASTEKMAAGVLCL